MGVEDGAGNLIDTVAVWFEQSGRPGWLAELTAWYSEVSAVGEDYSAVSGATRSAGAYSVQWSGPDGSGIPAGDYVVNIESLRERGSLSQIIQAFTVSGAATIPCPDDGELVDASLELAV